MQPVLIHVTDRDASNVNKLTSGFVFITLRSNIESGAVEVEDFADIRTGNHKSSGISLVKHSMTSAAPVVDASFGFYCFDVLHAHLTGASIPDCAESVPDYDWFDLALRAQTDALSALVACL
jgi:hypothetical protein